MVERSAEIFWAREKALLKVVGVRARSLPIAFVHTLARERGPMPRHQSSRVRGSRMSWSQLGRTCSSQRRERVALVSSFAHLLSMVWAAFFFSASRLSSIIRWYSFRCRFSSLLLFGGSQLGRVRLNTFSFSLLIGRGSIMMLLVRNGGSCAIGAVLERDSFSKLVTSPFCTEFS